MSSAERFELLTNSQFVDALCQGISSATERVYIQVMTFDGDGSGLKVADLLIEAAQRGVDVRLTVDLFAFRYVSDTRSTFPSVKDELRATHEMFDRMEAQGVDVTYVGPWGPLLLWGPVRSHKKIFVVDDAVYLGGINISDHNFEWFDLVVRTHRPEIVDATAADFLATRRGEREAVNGAIVTNEEIEVTFDEMIASAKESILIVSPYVLDFDFERRIEAATAPDVTVITPQSSNYRTIRYAEFYMKDRLLRKGVNLESFTDFFHSKFLMVDHKKVLIGSANFGRHSFRCNQEICVVIEQEDFVKSLLDVLPATQPIEHTPSTWRYWLGFAAESWLFSGIFTAEKVMVPRVPVLASR